MIDNDPTMPAVGAPIDITRATALLAQPGPTDRRPRALRWLLPMACSTAVPLTGQQQARLKLIAYH
jgi:hypothetical protein